MRKATLLALSAAAALGLLGPEVLHYAATRPSAVPGAVGNCRVIVLGCPARRAPPPSAIQEYRVESGVAAYRRYRCSALVLSGGKPHSAIPEADEMALTQAARGVEAGRVVLERSSRSTWENLQNTLPDVRPGEHVFLASDAFHVWRARRYLCKQRPDLCARAHSAAARGPARLFWYRWYEAYYNAFASLRDAARAAFLVK